MRINELHPTYDSRMGQMATTFEDQVTFWPRGKKSDTDKVLQSSFDGDSQVLHMRRLLQQFLVDVYCNIVKERLTYLCYHQKILRADDYINVNDRLLAEGDLRNVKKRMVLPT